MKTVNVAAAKNGLSRLLRRAERGESVIITERNRPVARLVPIEASTGPGEADLAALVAAGVLVPPAGAALDVAGFLAGPRAQLPVEASLAAAIQAERGETR
jgi:prevent-host-death family protein